jgi:hypothetical protein
MHPQITRQLAAAHRHDLLRAAVRERLVHAVHAVHADQDTRPLLAEVPSELLIYVTYALTGASRISFMAKPQPVTAVAYDCDV